jgi:large conductance mechanosensitive channel
MPPLGMAIGAVNFTDLALTLGANPANGEPVVLKYGAFLQNLFDFLIIALVVFIAIRAINKLKKPPQPAALPALPREEVLLQEIRDLLARQYR